MERQKNHGELNQDAIEKKLFLAALAARENAVATYSKFKVGAAIEVESGEVLTGCNIENATLGLTVCAERVAIWKALSEGHKAFRKIIIVADTLEPTPPCGPCRQILWEFAPEVEIALADLQRIRSQFSIKDLLPHPFDGEFLDASP